MSQYAENLCRGMVYLLVLISVVFFAVATVVQNRTVSGGGDFLSVAVLNNLPLGTFMALWCLITIDMSNVSAANWLLLLAAGLIWSISAYCRTMAYRYIDASVARIFGTMRLIFLTTAGIFIFKEKLTGFNIVGIVCTITAILYTVDFKSFKLTRGAWLNLISSFFATWAIIICKHLSTEIPFQIIVASDFFLPGLFLYLVSKNVVPETFKAIKISKNFLLIVPFLTMFGYYLKVKAFSMGGELIIISIIQHTGLIFVLAIEYFVLRSVTNFQRRCLAGGLCTIGAVLVTLY